MTLPFSTLQPLHLNTENMLAKTLFVGLLAALVIASPVVEREHVERRVCPSRPALKSSVTDLTS